MTPPVRPQSAALLPAVVAFVVLSGCASNAGKVTLGQPSATSNANGDTSSFEWGSCRDVDIAVDAATRRSARQNGMECATLTVPVDHAEPDGPTIDLAVARLAATGDDEERVGSLIVNPGGPGGSGLEFLASSGLAFSSDLRDHFDIVSFDPRGVAASAPLDCLTQDERAELIDEETPDDPATAVAEAAEHEAAIAGGCAEDDDLLFRHMGTDQVAGDVDLLREAVGDEQLTFLGLSYGTRIAAAYATMFPENVRAVVLDGSVTPSRDLVEQTGGQVKGIVRAVNAFVQQCDAAPGCPLAPDTLGRLTSAAERLDSTPLVVDMSGDDEPLTKDKFVTAVITSLYDPSSAMALADAVAALEPGADEELADLGARFILDLAGQQSSKRPDGSYGNGFETQGVVNCLDADGPLEVADLPRVRELAGPIPAFMDTDPAADTPSCTLMPTGDDLRIEANEATDRLLVVGTEGDPATPIEWTHQMVAALGNPATVIYGGAGHGASLSRPCVTEQVTDFLVSGTVPPSLQDCPRDPGEADIYAQIAAQFETMGLGRETGECIADAIRDDITPLEIVGLNGEDPDPDVVDELQDAAMTCARQR